MASETIMYTYTDEAPMLATHAFFPIIKAFCNHANVDVKLKDISVAARVLCQFPDYLKPDQQVPDELTELGKLAESGQANIIKLPNVSASLPQLQECIKELQAQGFALPDYPEEPKNEKEKDIKARYGKAIGSTVNPVLREGNSDRRSAVPVKEYAVRYPHKMGSWDASKTVVKCMTDGDFYSHERSCIMQENCEARIELLGDDGSVEVLREKWPMEKGDVIDSTYMDVKELQKYFESCIQDAKSKDILFSLHLKCTMMKVSDPIIFGHCVKVFYKDVFAKYAELFAKVGVNVNNGLGDLYKKIAGLPEEEQIKSDIMATYAVRGKIAMVDGGKGITNLHVPSDVIIDNSMPSALRDGGKMWNKEDEQEDFLATIPDRGYGLTYDEVVKFCQENGAFDPKTMGSCPNVGLMAKKAEEYGSHPNTFEMAKSGIVRIVNKASGKVILGQKLAKGDIFRACQTKDVAIKDWVKLAVARARANDFPAPSNQKPCKAIFWLDSARAHDVVLMGLVQTYLKDFDTTGLDIEIQSPVMAMRSTLQRAKEGLNTITVTGNVLRDYNTDLFPILELNTSAKMLSIVPMLNGGAMYETGAGGSAPKHVQQFQKESHLRWDSLGEYLALTCAFQDLAKKNPKAQALAEALNKAVGSFLIANKNPARKVKQIDNRGAHYWVARMWAEELSQQGADSALKEVFEKLAIELKINEEKILQDMIDCQGVPADLGGYYRIDTAKADKLMQPSETFNDIIDRLGKASVGQVAAPVAAVAAPAAAPVTAAAEKAAVEKAAAEKAAAEKAAAEKAAAEKAAAEKAAAEKAAAEKAAAMIAAAQKAAAEEAAAKKAAAEKAAAEKAAAEKAAAEKAAAEKAAAELATAEKAAAQKAAAEKAAAEKAAAEKAAAEKAAAEKAAAEKAAAEKAAAAAEKAAAEKAAVEKAAAEKAAAEKAAPVATPDSAPVAAPASKAPAPAKPNHCLAGCFGWMN